MMNNLETMPTGSSKRIKKKFRIRLYRHVKMNLGSTGILSCAANADARLHDSNAASDSVTALIGTLGYMQL
jgi:hypothetical protein